MKESFGVWKKVPKSMLYLFFSFSVTIFGFGATNLYIVIYATRVLLIDEVLWAFIIAILPLTTIFLAIPVGKSVDKFKRKIPLLASILIFGLAMWIFVHGSLSAVVFSLILFGAGQVMLNASFGALQTDLTPKEQRGKVNGFVNFSTCVLMAAGSLLGGYLYDQVSPQVPFLIAVVAVVPSFLLALTLVKEPEKKEE